MKKTTFFSSENAVSEVIDFVTILGILVLALGVIGVAGGPILKNAQEARHIENTRQGFTILAESMNKVMSGQAPSQSVEFKLYGDTLSVIQNSSSRSSMNITLLNGTGDTIFSQEYDLGTIEARFDNVVIGYENTGVWANYSKGGTIMVLEPRIVINNDSIFIPVTLIGLGSEGSLSVGGSGLVRVIVQGRTSDLIAVSDVRSARILVSGSNSHGWQKKYLNETKGWSELDDGQTMSKNFARPVNVFIQRELIEMSIES